MRSIAVVDNGSVRPEATLSLRRIAAALAARLGEPVAPISLQHVDRIDPAALQGVRAETLEHFLFRQAASSVHEYVLIPLFFGRSVALTEGIPQTVARARHALGEFRINLAPELYPLPFGESRLIEILNDHIDQLAVGGTQALDRVILVDHGSPSPRVTAVRNHIAEVLRERLAGSYTIGEAVMERRKGPAYDFNGSLVEDELRGMAKIEAGKPVGLAMLFITPGRHAGTGGDIASICQKVRADFPGFEVRVSPLVGEHPALIDLLEARVKACSLG